MALVDMRKSINGLAALVENELALSPMMEVLFVFGNRGRDKIKLLYWERNGFFVWYKRFAASSEKLDGQAKLFNEAETAAPVPEDDIDENTDDAETETIQYERRKPRGCKPLPVDWPRVRIEHDLSNADKVCECGCALTHIGEDTSEQLDIIPAKIQVLQHARLKYAYKACESTARTAALPAQPIPSSAWR
jgi:transposase